MTALIDNTEADVIVASASDPFIEALLAKTDRMLATIDRVLATCSFPTEGP